MEHQYGRNLAFAKPFAPDLFKEYVYAERNVYEHPYITLSRLRVIFETLTDLVLRGLSKRVGTRSVYNERLKALRGCIPQEIWRRLDTIRPLCNAACHNAIQDEPYQKGKITRRALEGLELARDYAFWYFETIAKSVQVESSGEFEPPPQETFEDQLKWVHEGDPYAALGLSDYHRQIGERTQENDFHRRMSEMLLDYAVDRGVTEAIIRRSSRLVYLSDQVEGVKLGISLIDKLIAQGEVINLYALKAIGFSRLNRSVTAETVAFQGCEAGDPYAMNLVAQWAGDSGHDIELTDDERAELFENSLEIAFNDEAAYYLSAWHLDQGRVPQALELLGQSVKVSGDPRKLLEFELGKLLFRAGQDPDRALKLIGEYAEQDVWSKLNAAEFLCDIEKFSLGFEMFESATKSALVEDFQNFGETFETVRNRLLDFEGFDDGDVNFLVECLG